MKKILAILLFISQSTIGQVTLKECVESGLANKATIKSANTEVVLASLKSIEAKAKYLPQISLAYQYRFNPIIATQVVPVGQFSPVPTDEIRGIRFGTNWQQDAGLTVFQPIIDLTLRNRIKESKLNESLSGVDLKKAEEDLQFEIVKTYSNALDYAYQMDEAIADTLRSFESLGIVAARFKEGKVLKTELNNALVNHNNNQRSFERAAASLVNEKIYLHYLTGISLERLLDESLAEIPERLFDIGEASFQIESAVDFQRLLFEEELINQKIKTDRKKYTPVIGLDGFIGANQFSQQFDPFLANSWYGISYVGLSVKMPIFGTDKSYNADKQLQTQLVQLDSKKEDLKAEISKELLQINTDIKRLAVEISFMENNVTLLKENVALYRERLLNGQFAAAELNVQEAELQKVLAQLNQLKAQLNTSRTERLQITGALGRELKTL